MKRRHRHDCGVALALDLPGRAYRSCCLALDHGTSRSTVAAWAREGCRHDVIGRIDADHVSRRFARREVNEWLAGRRGRQLRALATGDRYTHRPGPPEAA